MPKLPNREEVAERFIRNQQDALQICRCCQCEWTPATFNFWGLCETCFVRWCDVRIRLPPSEAYSHITPAHGYYCSCDEWINDGCPDPPSEPFVIHWL